MAADLHCHTKLSDGSVGINEIVLLAARSKVSTISITDHDTFAGAIRAGIFGRRHGVRVIPGAEFSACDSSTGRKAHILCYLCGNPDRLEGLCRRMREERRRAAAAMLQRVMELYPITAEMVVRRSQGSSGIYKQHIMHALIDAGYADRIYGPVYDRLFHPGTGLAYVPVSYPEVHDVIGQIHDAGGVVVLAHPGEYGSYDLLAQLARDHEIDGVEVWHPKNRQGDEALFAETALKYGLVMTGGTDFHGMYTTEPMPLGTCTTPDDQLRKLLALGSRSSG